ncbi:MAG: hypothetical protein HDQ88_04990 [Clostridia bacterium]|nr:hypothetical protein [Clostridia bacterium]
MYYTIDGHRNQYYKEYFFIPINTADTTLPVPEIYFKMAPNGIVLPNEYSIDSQYEVYLNMNHDIVQLQKLYISPYFTNGLDLLLKGNTKQLVIRNLVWGMYNAITPGDVVFEYMVTYIDSSNNTRLQLIKLLRYKGS